MAKKITALFLVILLCLCSLTSCFIVINKDGIKNEDGNDGDISKEDPVTPMADPLEAGKKKAEEVLNQNFSDVNLGSQSFTVVIADDVDTGFDNSGETSYLKAIDIQKNLISDKLNCVLNINVVSYTQLLSDAQAAQNAGLFYADIICVPQKAIGFMRSQGLLMNLNTVLGDIYSDTGYDLNSINQASGNNAVYGVGGLGTVTPGSYGCVYFNKDVADNIGVVDEIYECVNNGRWTIDKMLEFGNAYKVAGVDMMLVGAESAQIFSESLFGAAGMNYVDTSVSSVPELSENGALYDELISKLKSLVGDYERCVLGDDARGLFEDDKLFFYIDTLENAKEIKGAYGIVPLPKLNDAQEKYYTFANGNAKVYAVLNTNARTDYVPTLMKAFNDTSEILHDAWARDYLDYALRDEASYKNIKAIFKNAKYDFAYMYGEQYESIANSTYGALYRVVADGQIYNNVIASQATQFGKDITALFP